MRLLSRLIQPLHRDYPKGDLWPYKDLIIGMFNLNNIRYAFDMQVLTVDTKKKQEERTNYQRPQNRKYVHSVIEKAQDADYEV